MTLIRELELRDGRIYQMPAREYKMLREKEMDFDISD
jgi:sucrose-6-phosphate hydrolase SacC (GH32 family)